MSAAAVSIPSRLIDRTQFLPTEVMERLFGLMSTKDVALAARVCSAWYSTIKDDRTQPRRIEIGRSRVLLDRAMAELPFRALPREMLTILYAMRMRFSVIPRVEYLGCVTSNATQVAFAPLTLYSAEAQDEFERPGKKLVLRIRGKITFYEGKTFPDNSVAQIRIFEENVQRRVPLPLNYKELNSVFSNPHSIIWLYCGGETPYYNLAEFFDTGHKAVLF